MAEFHQPLRDYMAEHADLPEGWEWFEVKVLDHQGRDPKDWRYDRYRGAVYPHLITRGPRKGSPNYRKPAPGTERTVILDQHAYRAWLPTWEAKTGQCSTCAGEGEVTAGWSVERGRQTKPCRRCGGTGSAQGENAA